MGEMMYERPYYSERERRQLLRRFLEREATALRDETKDPETRRFAEKALGFLAQKERIEARKEAEETAERLRRRVSQEPESPHPIPHVGTVQESHSRTDYDVSGVDASGGTTRKQPKKFGIFWAVEAKAEMNMMDPESGFSLSEGDFYVELHLPPVEQKDRTLEKAKSSLESLAQYLDENSLTPKYVLGITYERLANASTRMGFEVIDPALPTDLRESVARFNRAAQREGLKDEPMGDLLLAYQDGETFLNTFSPNRLSASGEAK